MKTIPLSVKYISLVLLLFVVFGCSKSDDNGGDIQADDGNEIVDGDGQSNDGEPQGDGDEGGKETATLKIVDLVGETDELSQLGAAVVVADLASNLNADGPYTLFAPTNDAIDKLFGLLGDDYSSFEDFDTFLEKLILKQILLYHVVPQKLESTDLMEGSYNTLLDDEIIQVIASGETFVIGDASTIDANITAADNLATNGVVHIIDKILIPQEVQNLLDAVGIGDGDGDGDFSGFLPTIAAMVASSEDFDFLYQALKITGLLETLDGDGPFTVFAPSNETIIYIAGLLGFVVDDIDDLENFDTQFEIDILTKVLMYHVVAGEIGSQDLTSGEVETLLGDDITVKKVHDGFVLQDALDVDVNFVATDIPASNGVIHLVDRILIPQSVIDMIISETEENLIQAIQVLQESEMFITAYYMVRDHFEEFMEDPQPFTFFLPTDEAFTALFDTLDGIDSLADFDTPEELELLSTVLSYHLLWGTKAESGDFTTNQRYTTVQGETVTVLLGDDEVRILDKTDKAAVVVKADMVAASGVVHLIDKVLLPQAVIDLL